MNEYNNVYEKMLLKDIIDIYEGKYENYEKYYDNYIFEIEEDKENYKYFLRERPILVSKEYFDYIIFLRGNKNE